VGLPGVVCLDAFIQGEMPAAEYFRTDTELASGRAGPLHSPLRTTSQSLDVLHRRCAAAPGVVIGVLSVGCHHPYEGGRGDVVLVQDPPASAGCRRQHFI
jgi:hypothetical protein